MSARLGQVHDREEPLPVQLVVSRHVPGAEFLGDPVSFKWGKAAEALFSLKRRQVALLEGELTAPGNEVAYIVKAGETFGNE